MKLTTINIGHSRRDNSTGDYQQQEEKPLISEQVAIHRLHRLELADETMLMDVDKLKSVANGVKEIDGSTDDVPITVEGGEVNDHFQVDNTGGDDLNEVIEEESDAI